MILNKNSLHYRLATKYGDLWLWRDEGTDICTYTRHVMKGVVFVLLATAGMAVLGCTLLDMAIWFWVMARNGFFIEPGIGAAVGFASSVAVALFALFALACNLWGSRRKKSDGYWANAAAAVKGKYCFRVEFEGRATHEG